jgi:hypothetical protein
MSSERTPAPRQHDATGQPSVKNVFDREPLLIPPRAEDRRRALYRRRATLATMAIVAVAAIAAVRFGASLSRGLLSVLGR